MKNLLTQLCSASGAPGDEAQAAELTSRLLSEYCEISHDNLGSVIGKLGNTGTHIMLEAHLDRIGLIVTDIDETGFLRFAKCGGADIRLLCGAEVTVWGKEPLYGVICSTPPHLSNPEERGTAKDITALGIDIGLSRENAEKAVTLGDRVTFNALPRPLSDNRFTAAALDDRAGVAVILRTLELLKNEKLNCRLTVVFSVCEETGGSGAKVAAFAAAPDEAICFDVSFGDSPGVPQDKCRPLGSGAMLGIAPTLSRDMCKNLKAIAERDGINYTLEIMGGRTSTDSDDVAVSGKGVKTMLISIPLRNMHSAAEVIDLRDIEACAQITAAYIRERSADNA